MPMKSLPGFLGQWSCIDAIEDRAPTRPNRIEQRIHRRVMIRRKGRHLVGADGEGLERRDLMDHQVQALADLRIEETGGRKIRLEHPCSPLCRSSRGIEVQSGCIGHAVLWTAREEVRGVQMV